MKRRRFLQSLPTSALALGLPSFMGPLIQSSQADAAQNGRKPLRVVFFMDTPSPLRKYSFPIRPDGKPWPTQAGAPQTYPGEAWGEWDLQAPLKPLNEAFITQKMINLVGIDPHIMNVKEGAQLGGHFLLPRLMSSMPSIDRTVGTGVSIDQFIANDLVKRGIITPLHSLGMNVGQRTSSSGSLNTDGTPRTLFQDPLALYDHLFPPDLFKNTDGQDRLKRRRRSIHHLVKSLGSTNTSHLPREQRDRIEAHMELHSQVQKRLNASLGFDITSIPQRERVAKWDEGEERFDSYRYARVASDLKVELAALALQADLTRVIYIQHSWPAPEQWDFVPGQEADPKKNKPAIEGTFGKSNDHGFHHRVTYGGDLEQDPKAIAAAIKFEQNVSGRLRQFIDLLQSLPDGDGHTLFDNTLILMCTAMSDPSHINHHMTWRLIGDAHGKFRTGRNLLLPRGEWDRDQDKFTGKITPLWKYNQGKYGSGTGKVWVADLFTSIANAMGSNIQHFGHRDACHGPLDMLT